MDLKPDSPSVYDWRGVLREKKCSTIFFLPLVAALSLDLKSRSEQESYYFLIGFVPRLSNPTANLHLLLISKAEGCHQDAL